MNQEETAAINPSNPSPLETSSSPASRLFCAIAALSVLGLAACIPLLFPAGLDFFADFLQTRILHKPIRADRLVEAKQLLRSAALLGIAVILFVDFFALAPWGRTILDKINFIDISAESLAQKLKALFRRAIENRFELFALLLGGAVFAVAVARAANSSITNDESFTYRLYVLPGFVKSMMNRWALNNHILNTVLIQFVCWATQTRYNEFFIRLPNLVFYAAYLYAAYRAAKESKTPYALFVLFAANYYLNEFMGLARGYGIAAACVLLALYHFKHWAAEGADKNLYRCMLWISLAALANGIVLYLASGIVMLIFVKYRRNIFKLSFVPFYAAFFFVAVFTVYVSGRSFRREASPRFSNRCR